MNQKLVYDSLKSKGKNSLAGLGLLSILMLGSQATLANPEPENRISVSIFQSTVSGTVLDSEGVPLPGANVFEKGTTNGTQTDFDGNFSLEVDSQATLVISYLGFKSQEVTVNGQSTITITLAEDAAALEEVVVTGYQTETKRETTAAVSVVQAEKLAAIPSGNVEQQLQGRVAGVTVLTNGQPGTTSQIRIRGFGAFGGNEPLYVVDGLPVGNTEFLNPDDIATTTVLKDAAAASIYGARAANGVVVYTTKSGSRGKRKTEMTINISSGVSDPNSNGAIETLSPFDQARYTHIAYENNAAVSGDPVVYNHPQYGSNPTPVLPEYLYADGLNGVSASEINFAEIAQNYENDPENTFLIKSNLAGTNWYKEITRIAPISRFTVGFDGGTDNGRFYSSISGQTQAGILLNNDFERYTARFNSEWDIAPWLSIGENFQVTYRSVTGGFGGEGGIGGADDESRITDAIRMSQIIPVYDEFGSFASTKAAGFGNPRNPVRVLKNDDGNDQAYGIGGTGNVYVLLKPIDGLTLRSSLGGTYNNSHYVSYSYRYLGDAEPQANNGFSEGSSYFFGWTFTNTASYDKTFGKHRIKALAGVEALNTGKGRNINGSGTNPFSTDVDFQSLSVVQNPVVNSSQFKGVNFYSIFGKLDYNFDEKYYLTGVLRRDGASRFGGNNRYGVFPAVSGAWRVIAEPFLQNQDIISDLKIRGGWGQMGNSNNVNPNNQYSLYASDRGGTFYQTTGQASGADEGFAASRIGNPNAKWETSTSTNIGFDLSLFNNRLEFILDWWKKDTEDLLYQLPLPGVTGNFAAAPSVNIAKMSNKGIDFEIIGRGNLADDFTFEASVTAAFLNNEIVSLAPGLDFFDGPAVRDIRATRNAVGQSLSAFYGYNVIGYFNSQAEVDANVYVNDEGETLPAQDGQGLGRFKYEDVNGDGRITPDDRKFLGSPVPDFTGGLTLNLKYKQLEFETFWYTSIGNEIWNQTKWYTDFYGTFEGAAKGTAAFKSWTPELGNNAVAPRWESASNFSTNTVGNSWYVEDGTYVRLQRIGLSYDFRELTERLGLTKLKIGLAANNIWTITNYGGIDPGVGGGVDTNFGIDIGNYPVSPQYLINFEIGI
ncbi:SusC/RagA family TonB-linked outer membrane protein [Euzebyella saccharophila]|uniref:SusC/RagA family TonB-linked outer membrane protein n=1 Tax=Euzebyella saccharophila TaxID=679664 RepID=A0ABV8JU59_9FLAO|nr:SusC/RagA family TonB-linked outer membrane protein [Euzebyella saccharophila]